MRNNKNYNHWDNTEDDDVFDDESLPPSPSFKAVAIGAAISVAVIYGALRLWNVFQRP